MWLCVWWRLLDWILKYNVPLNNEVTDVVWPPIHSSFVRPPYCCRMPHVTCHMCRSTQWRKNRQWTVWYVGSFFSGFLRHVPFFSQNWIPFVQKLWWMMMMMVGDGRSCVAVNVDRHFSKYKPRTVRRCECDWLPTPWRGRLSSYQYVPKNRCEAKISMPAVYVYIGTNRTFICSVCPSLHNMMIILWVNICWNSWILMRVRLTCGYTDRRESLFRIFLCYTPSP